VLRSYPVPRKIVTAQLRSYLAAKASVPQLAGVKHVSVKASTRANNRAENSHEPTRRRERQMQVSAIHGARSTSCRTSGRSGNTSRCPVTAWALLLTAPN